MPHHSECRLLPYPPETLYRIVEDVARYPEFLPWVREAKIIRTTDRGFIADLKVGYNFFQDTYRSEVILTPFESIEVRYIHGPFKHLHNSWQFSPVEGQGVQVDFLIDFDFKSSFFQGLMQTLFAKAVPKMVTAFEERARVLSVPAF